MGMEFGRPGRKRIGRDTLEPGEVVFLSIFYLHAGDEARVDDTARRGIMTDIFSLRFYA